MTAAFRPRLSLPVTVIPEPGTVHLVAGEDVRYSLSAPAVETWLPPLIASCDGCITVEGLLDRVDAAHRPAAERMLERLRGERLLIDGTALDAHSARSHRLAIMGTGELARIAGAIASADGDPLPLLCQDWLDYGELLTFHRERHTAGEPWLWASIGPVQRGYVSPVFLPDAGPCVGCLLRHFRRLSPAPEFYDLLQSRDRQDLRGPLEAVAPEAYRVLADLAAWKVRHLGWPQPPAAIYRLHVLELANMEVSTHRVLIDPECPECRRGSVG